MHQIIRFHRVGKIIEETTLATLTRILTLKLRQGYPFFQQADR